MLMPKAPSHLDDLSQPWKHDVWLSGKVGRVKAISVSHPMHEAADGKLGPHILASDTAHVRAAA